MIFYSSLAHVVNVGGSDFLKGWRAREFFYVGAGGMEKYNAPPVPGKSIGRG
jgi:hypothetical protein